MAKYSQPNRPNLLSSIKDSPTPIRFKVLYAMSGIVFTFGSTTFLNSHLTPDDCGVNTLKFGDQNQLCAEQEQSRRISKEGMGLGAAGVLGAEGGRRLNRYLVKKWPDSGPGLWR